MKNQDIQNKLLAPFNDSDIEWRLQWVNNDNTSGLAVPYVDNRAIQTRLDDVIGIDNWKNEYIPWHNAMYMDSNKNKRQFESQICGISIYFEGKNEWITKYDGAEDSEIESIKGGLSDSMKRAAVQWGIGRYLYSTESVFVDVELNKKGKPDFKKGQRDKLDGAHQACVKKMFRTTATSTQQKPSKEQNSQPAQNTAASQQVPHVPAQSAQVQQQAAQAVQSFVPKTVAATDGSYCIVNAVLTPSVRNGNNTNLQLRDTNGKTIQAYMQGTHPGLVPGTWIVNAQITSQMKEDIVFFSLNGFDFATQQAA